MREFAKRFYKSRRWQAVSKSYAKSVGNLCEACESKGLIVPGEIVHHKIPLTPENINDPSIALGWGNLELLCRTCHAEQHAQERCRHRYAVDAQGNVTAREQPPLISPAGTPRETGVREFGIPLPRGKGGVKGGKEVKRTADQD